jgi:hypothetical protein
MECCYPPDFDLDMIRLRDKIPCAHASSRQTAHGAAGTAHHDEMSGIIKCKKREERGKQHATLSYPGFYGSFESLHSATNGKFEQPRTLNTLNTIRKNANALNQRLRRRESR